MKPATFLSLVILALAASAVLSKPIFDYSKSYVLRLTDFNINDQIHKIRRSTNYVSVVFFYKHGGILGFR